MPWIADTPRLPRVMASPVTKDRAKAQAVLAVVRATKPPLASSAKGVRETRLKNSAGSATYTMKAFIQASPRSECPMSRPATTPRQIQPEEGQRQVENLSEARFHPADKKQEREAGRRSESGATREKRDRQHLLGSSDWRISMGVSPHPGTGNALASNNASHLFKAGAAYPTVRARYRRRRPLPGWWTGRCELPDRSPATTATTRASATPSVRVSQLEREGRVSVH